MPYIKIIALLISLGGVSYMISDYMDARADLAIANASAKGWQRLAQELEEEKRQWAVVLTERNKENAVIATRLAIAKDKLNDLSTESKQYLALPIPNDLLEQLQARHSKASKLP